MAHVSFRTSLTLLVLGCLAAASPPPWRPAPLHVVGVLGNSAGLDARPVPYAFYTGIGADPRGRLYLAGAAEGVPVCDQDGACLAVLPLPQADGMVARSLMAVVAPRGSDTATAHLLFFVAQHPGTARGALYRIDTDVADPATLAAVQVTAGPGYWALSPVADTEGYVLLGRSYPDTRQYEVLRVDPGSGATTALFTLEMPPGATRPWKHEIQADEDGGVSIIHLGGVNWSGRCTAQGTRTGEARPGQRVGPWRYEFGYDGGLRRNRLDGERLVPAPGECGAGLPEIRMAAQLVQVGDRWFFAGRGGAVEARWTGTNVAYARRLGGVWLEDLADAGAALRGIAFTASGNNDVQHWLTLPKTQPVGQLLQASGPVHSRQLLALAPAPHGTVAVYRARGGLHLFYDGPGHLEFDLPLAGVGEAGQLAVQGNDLLLADPKSGTVWRRPLMDKTAPFAAWRDGLAGVTGLAAAGDAVFAATPTRLFRLGPDGTAAATWQTPPHFQGVRRLAATPDHVYVCDTAAHSVYQCDARTGALLAQLGVPGEPGNDLQHLRQPWAVAADLNGVYIADNGNGRVLVATTTLWRPEIPRLPREDNTPLVAVVIPAPPSDGLPASVNVYDVNDVTVRQLLCRGPLAPGHPLTWDGKDMYGRWAAPGTYRYHGIVLPGPADGLRLRYVTSIGQSGQPPCRTADGRGSWGGVWGNVMDICPVSAAPDSDIVVLWAFEEGEGGLIRMSQDGEVRWKQHLDWWMKAQQAAVASDGTDIYVAGASALNAPAGQSNYTGTWNRPLLWRVSAATGAKKLYSPEQARQPMFGEYKDQGRIVTDLAVRDGRLYLSAPAQDTLFVIDAATAALLAAWPLPAASGVAFAPGGRLLAGSGERIVELSAEGKVVRDVAAAEALVWDVEPTADGGLVATVGAPRHQVLFFGPDGRERRALGTRGGRPLCGRMQPRSFREPVGLCLAGNGSLFVAENATPKRFTRWSPDGTLTREFHGPYYFSGMFGVDDENPELIYADTHADLIRYRVDYDTGAWDVEHYWIGAYEQAGVPIKWWPRIRHRDGKTYWCSGSGAIAELQEERVRGVAAVYGGWVKPLPDGGYEPRYHQEKTGFKGTWSDLNGDGQKQSGEWQVTDRPAYPLAGSGPQQGWGAYFDESFDLYMHDWSDGEVGGVWQIPVAEWRDGVPVYRWEAARQAGLPRLGIPGLAHGSPGARTAFAADGAVYAFNGGYNAAGLPGVGHGHDWEFAQVTKYDAATGRPLWHAGERCPAFAAPGQHYCPTGAAGIIGELLFWTDENSLVHVWETRHGLYVGTLLEDIMRGPPPSPYTVWVELFNTRVFRHPRTGKVYLLAGSDAIHVYEVLGTDAPLRRFAGEFTLTAEGLERARRQDAARLPPRGRVLDIPRAPTPVGVDGDGAEFADTPPATLALNETAGAEFRLLRDDTHLYVRCDVRDESPWKNAGGDPTALFKTGDEVSVWLGPGAGTRAPGTADTRVLFAPAPDGKVCVVLYRPKVATGARPVTFRSPSGQLVLDAVAETAAVPAAVQVTAAGYRLLAAIPWRELGLEPTRSEIGLDLSVNFSDPAGQRNVARLHWGRNGAALVYDLPSEARFEPETWGTGRLAPAAP